MRQELTIKATADAGCHTVISLELGGPGCLSPILFHAPVCRVSQRPPTSGWSGFRKVSGSSGGRHKTLKLALAFLTLPSTHLPAAQRPCREAHLESGLGTRLQHGGGLLGQRTLAPSNSAAESHREEPGQPSI